MSGYTPSVGDLVSVQLWNPQTTEPKTAKYGPPRIRLIKGIDPDYQGRGLVRYWYADPKRPNDEASMGWSESDWTDVEPAAEELGMLF